MASNTKKRRLNSGNNDAEPPPSSLSDVIPGGEGRKIIVLLDKAVLETTKTKRNEFELLNCDDHRHIARKNGLDPSLYRPDIIHQVH
jgi:rRNA small subunit pseudouridine methyltransferase Nep1